MGSSRKAGEGLGEATLTMMWARRISGGLLRSMGCLTAARGGRWIGPNRGFRVRAHRLLNQWSLAKVAVPCQSAVLPDVPDEESPARARKSRVLRARYPRYRGSLVAAQLRHTRLHELHGPEEVRMTPLGP